MQASVDLNADMSESFGPWAMGDDAALLEVVSSANIACGFRGRSGRDGAHHGGRCRA